MTRVEMAREINAKIKDRFKELDTIKQEYVTLEEALIETRKSLVPLPVPGEEWDGKKSYIVGDTVTFGGIKYVARHFNKGKQPDKYPDEWEIELTKPEYSLWADDPDMFEYREGDIREHIGKLWICTSDHLKIKMYEPKASSSKWLAFNPDEKVFNLDEKVEKKV